MEAELRALTEIQLMQIFNEVLLGFIDMCEEVCTEEHKKEYVIHKEKAKTAIQLNGALLIDNFVLYITNCYGELINNKDIKGLMEMEYKELAMKDGDIEKILNIKQMLTDTSEEKRIDIMQTLYELNQIASMYFLKKHGKL